MGIKIFTKFKNAFANFMKEPLSTNFLKSFTEEQKELGIRIFGLVNDRVLERVYSGLDEKNRENMEKVFLSDDNSAKEKFIKEYMPCFDKFFKEESKKIQEEIEIDIMNKFSSGQS